MSSKYKAAPPFFDSEAGSYERWKEDLAIWHMLSDLSNPKQAQFLYLSLKGKAKDAVGDVKADQLEGNEEGIKLITDKLDNVFLKDINTRAFYAFQEFYEYKRASGDTFESFIVKFEQLHTKVSEFKMVLPDGVRAFFILRAANITSDNDKLVRTTASELSYGQVKDKLKKVFGNFSGSDDDDCLPVKEEVMYTNYNNNNNYRGRGSSRGRPAFRGRGGFSRRGQRGQPSKTVAFNVPSKGILTSNNTRKCHLCFGTDHLVHDCPHKGTFAASLETFAASGEADEPDDTHDVHIVLMNGKADNKQLVLVRESLGKGLLDCGCTRTVAGSTWMNEFLHTLPQDEAEKVKHSDSDAKFRFGDGAEYKSSKELIIPVVIAGKHQFMKVDVVPCEIPLLISVGSMKRMNMTLDCGNDIAYVYGKRIELSCTTSDYYCLPVNIGYSYINIILDASTLSDLPRNAKLKKALKLHGHVVQKMHLIIIGVTILTRTSLVKM